MKKICCVTAARSEYGLLKWLMKDIEQSSQFELQVVVTGGHLLKEQGHTIDQIREDGFNVNYIVDKGLDVSAAFKIAESMGKMAIGFSEAFEELKPDYVLVLGDRYELLPICNTAFIMGIPIIHLSGGDITEGAIDDGIRNAVTMLATYHFPGTREALENIIRMKNSNKNVWNVGEPGLDSFNREQLLSRKELASNLKLDENSKWVLMTYHSETKESVLHNLQAVKNCVELLLEESVQVVITYANADLGGKEINEYLEECAKMYPEKIRVVPSLGHSRYLSFMRQVEYVIGNSSSGIVEAPFMNIPSINIGNRQKGRYLCGNVVQSEADRDSIKSAIEKIELIRLSCPDDLHYWGNGHTSEQILEILEKEIG